MLDMKNGWEIKKLGEVCQIKNGRNQSNVVDSNGKYPIYGSGGIMGYANDYICDEGCTIIGRKGSINNPIYVTTKFWNVDTAFGFSPLEKLNSRFLYYFCLGFNFKELDKGTTLPSLTKTDLSLINFPLPPLSIQQEIVSILEETFEAIAQVKANAEQNLKNAKALFESYLQSVFENKDKRWEEVKLMTLAIDITDGDHMPPPKTEEGIPFITISNIDKNSHEIDFSNTFSVSNDYFKRLKANRKPRKGDILYTVTGSYGVPVLIERNKEFCFQRHIGLIRPKENISNKWLFYWILSPQAFKQANDTATGTAQKTVSLSSLRNFIIPKMTLKEQQTIVKKLDALSTETKRLEAIYQQKLKDVEELKKVILEKAFKGELTGLRVGV